MSQVAVVHELNCRVVKCLLIYVRKRFGEHALTELSARCGLTLQHLENENGWLSYRDYLTLLEELAALSGNDRVAYEQGLEAASYEAYGALYVILRAFATPKIAYQTLGQLFPRWTRTGTFTTLQLTRTQAVMQFVNHPQFPQHRLNCLSIQGQLASIPMAWGIPPAYVEHVECQLEGKARCLYSLTWVPRPSFGTVACVVAPGVVFTIHQVLDGTAGSLAFGLCVAALLVVAGFYLDTYTILAQNRHITNLINESTAKSLQTLEARNQDLNELFLNVQKQNHVSEALRRLSVTQAEALDESELLSDFLGWLSVELGFGPSAFLMADRNSAE